MAHPTSFDHGAFLFQKALEWMPGKQLVNRQARAIATPAPLATFERGAKGQGVGQGMGLLVGS